VTKEFRKENKAKAIRISKGLTAYESIGQLKKDTDLFILTYGQFSLVDALIAVLDQIGPAHVTISTWTAASAHLEKTAQLIESAEMLSFKMIVDRSFETRQPEYCEHMRHLFGAECVRAIRSHAKFMLIRNDEWNLVFRTSMNLNENPRLENLEISDNLDFAEFFQVVVDEIFREVGVGENRSSMLDFDRLDELSPYQLVSANHIKRSSVNEPTFTHTVK
jgi:hypothetical protein